MVPSYCGGGPNAILMVLRRVEVFFETLGGSFLGCFSTHLGVTTTFCAELQATMEAIRIAKKRGWDHLWLECDSTLVVRACTSQDLDTWWHKSQWFNCCLATHSMSFNISHVFREGNQCADRLANFGVTSHGSTWCDTIPDFVRELFSRDISRSPNFRFG